MSEVHAGGLPDLDLFKEVPSPSLVFFPEVIANNVAELIRMVGNDPARLRSHCKTHKSSRVAKILLDQGIEKHKCATLAEAKMLIQAGVRDILISYPLVGPHPAILRRMAADFPEVRFSFLVDEPSEIPKLAATFADSRTRPGLFIDLDGGMGRTGIDVSGAQGQRKIAQLVETIAVQGFKLFGVQLYDGHVNQEKSSDRHEAAAGLWRRVESLRAEIPALQAPQIEVVVGGSPSFMVHSGLDWQGVTHSPGTVVLHDHGYGSKYQDMESFQWGAAVLTRVISKPVPGRMTLDLGHKSVAADPPLEKRAWFPAMRDAKLLLQNEEHLVVSTAIADQTPLGTLFWAIPWHICPTVALHEKALVFADNQLKSWWPIEARTRFTGYEMPS